MATESKTDLDAMFQLKRIIEGLFRDNYPPTPEGAAYNQALSDAMKEIMAMIHKTLEAQLR